MTEHHDSIRVVIPLTVRKRNGRPKILPPEGTHYQEARSQDPHILKALGRAWAWRRRLESGQASTISDIAKDENVTDRFVSRTMRLAYLDPEVLERLLVNRLPPSVSWQDLVGTTYLPWFKQSERVFSHALQHSNRECGQLEDAAVLCRPFPSLLHSLEVVGDSLPVCVHEVR